MRALVLSASNHRGAFAAIRRLHEAGWVTSAGTSDPSGLVSWSRATEAVYPTPPPEQGIEQFLEALVVAVRRSGAEVVLPSDDADLIALSAIRDRVPAVVPLASDDVVRRIVDKLELMRAGQAAGLTTPRTSPADADALDTASYPVVVKPRYHWLPEHGSAAPARLPTIVCHSGATAAAHADAIRRHGGEPLLQEHIKGTPVCIHLVADRSGTVLGLDQQECDALFYPPGAGVRVRSVTAPTDPQLASGVGRLIADNGWYGFAGIQLLRGEDGVERLIDFNGRIPASLEASAGAGPNYLAAWAALATNRQVPTLQSARPGTRTHWLEGDFRRAVRERRGGLVRDVVGTLAYSFGATHTVIKRDEPVVALRYALHLIRKSRYAAR